MPTVHRVTFEMQSSDWRRGKSHEIAEEFDIADPDTGYDASIRVTYEIPQADFQYVPDEWEAYRLARNKAEAKADLNGWDVTFSNVEVEKVRRESESIENPTIDDATNWVEYEDEGADWLHEPTNQWLAIKEDGPNVREDWHSDMWCEDAPWAVVHKFTVIARKETEEEARETALEWMVANPYALDPANSY